MNNKHWGTEIYAGMMGFLSSAYILIVHPHLLSQAGLSLGTAFYATIFMIVLSIVGVAILTKKPLLIGPAMVLNTFFTVTLVQQDHFLVSEALGIVAASGLGVLFCVVLGISDGLNALCPQEYFKAILYGIALLMLRFALSMSEIISHGVCHIELLGWFSFCLLLLLYGNRKQWFGASFFIFLGCTIGYAWLSPHPTLGTVMPKWQPPAVAFTGLFTTKGLLACLSLTLLNLLDTSATVAGTAAMLELAKKESADMMKRVLAVVGLGSILGAFVGSSNINPYIESTVPIHFGSRSCISTLCSAVLFLLSFLMFPLLAWIPSVLSAAMLAFVALSILQSIPTFLSEHKEAWLLCIPILGIPLTNGILYPMLLLLSIAIIRRYKLIPLN